MGQRREENEVILFQAERQRLHGFNASENRTSFVYLKYFIFLKKLVAIFTIDRPILQVLTAAHSVFYDVVHHTGSGVGFNSP